MKLQHTQRGATLIEVMVAIVVMAVGLFGMAALTASAARSNQFSRMRAAGLSLVGDYAERARANTAGFASYAYTTAYAASSRTAATTDPTTAVAGCAVEPLPSRVNDCGPAIASYDQSQWLTHVANRLPGGTAYVTAESIPAPADVPGLPDTRVLNIWLIWSAIQEADGFQLQKPCPKQASISTADMALVNCMYFRVTL